MRVVDWAARIAKETNNEYLLVETTEKIRIQSTVEILHVHCGHKYTVRISTFFHDGQGRCPICTMIQGGVVRRHTIESIQAKAKLYPYLEEYEVIEWINDKKQIRLKHKPCGHIYTTGIHSVFDANQNFTGCPVCCSGARKLSLEIVKKRILNMMGDEFEVLDTYTEGLDNRKRRVKLRHSCGHEWLAWFNNDSKYTCPVCCPRSSGESIINGVLIRHNLVFVKEYPVLFHTKTKFPSRYDFAVFNKNRIVLLIEFDGKQHYHPIKRWGGEESFSKRKKNDRRKDLYAWVKGIPLLRIPYWEQKNIERLLTEKLTELGLLRPPSLLEQWEKYSKGPVFFELTA